RVKLRADESICLGATVQLNASGTSLYNWIVNTTGLSNTSIADPVAGPVVSTTYTVIGSDDYHCFADTAKINIRVLPLPTVAIPAVPDLLLGMPVQLTGNTSNDVVEWTWSPADYLSCSNCPSPVSTPGAAITYTLKVKNSNGCTASASVLLKLQCQESKVFIPAAFSPNDDGKNDLFSIKGISIVKHLVIYSRWGKRVFERSNFIAGDRSSGWDGRTNGESLPAGAYTYFVEMECPAGGIFTRKGTVMLLR
ncbi:MAG: gliding motility-associated C-terminal domain-containing protein, partial [Ferruginibacter sp.]